MQKGRNREYFGEEQLEREMGSAKFLIKERFRKLDAGIAVRRDTLQEIVQIMNFHYD